MKVTSASGVNVTVDTAAAPGYPPYRFYAAAAPAVTCSAIVIDPDPKTEAADLRLIKSGQSRRLGTGLGQAGSPRGTC